MTVGKLSTEVVLGTAFALFVGKPIGILGFGWLSVRLGLAQLPLQARWSQLTGASMLGGIGFTMSLFFAGVAFSSNGVLAISAKLGILIGSIAAAIFGIVFLAAITGRNIRQIQQNA